MASERRWGQQLWQDLAAGLTVEVVEERKATEELHLCVRPLAAGEWQAPTEEDVTLEAQGGPDDDVEWDWFQRAAFRCNDRQESVLVAAPTSAGKTAVARHAIKKCIDAGKRCVYTAPVKALSNEKFGDFVKEFGEYNVALLTGDSKAGCLESAPLVVMTTEVLVSMLHTDHILDRMLEDEHEGSRPWRGLMQELGLAVFDEVHYIADEERGTAWEESIVLLERHVHLVCLSATVPNYLEIAGWLAQTRHAPCHAIYTRHRPVPLEHSVVPCPPADKVIPVSTLAGHFKRKAFEAAIEHLPKQKQPSGRSDENRGKELASIVQECKSQKCLPLIIFSFSRNASAFAARQLASVLRLRPDACGKVQSIVRAVREKQLNADDQDLWSVRECMDYLLPRGVGLHHGGLLPVLRELTEKLFKEGLVRVLCTTETFAVGVNMPSRAVIFNWAPGQEFRKFDGQEQRQLRVREYMQIAGRAGRRNQDVRGAALSLVSQQVSSKLLHKLVAGRAEPVESQFRLSYPLILRCLRSGGGILAVLVWQSFKQFQTGSVNRLVFHEELQGKLKVLCELGLIIEEGYKLTLEGQAGAHIQVSGLPLLTIRLLLNGCCAGLEKDEAANRFVAFLTCLVNDTEEPEEVVLPEEFDPWWVRCEDELSTIYEVSCRCGVVLPSVDGVLHKLRRSAGFVEAMLAWMRGETFEHASLAAGGKDGDGILARVIRRTHSLLKEFDAALSLLGHDDSVAALYQVRYRLHRGGAAHRSLPFLESIWLPLAFEPDTLDLSVLRPKDVPCPHEIGEEFMVHPSSIGFSHFSISSHFKDGNSIASTLKQLRDGMKKREITMVEVYWTEGQYWTLANRRLAVFRLFEQLCPERGSLIKVKRASEEAASRWGFWRRWTTGLWRGRRAQIRGTAELIGRTSAETTFFSRHREFEVPVEADDEQENGFRRALPEGSFEAELVEGCEEESHDETLPDIDTDAEAVRKDTGGADDDDEDLLFEECFVALNQRRVADFLIHRELDDPSLVPGLRAISQPASAGDLLCFDRADFDATAPIPERFGDIHKYLCSFALPALEELREDLRQSLEPQAEQDVTTVNEPVELLSLQEGRERFKGHVPKLPPWFPDIEDPDVPAEVVVPISLDRRPAKVARDAPGQVCLLFEEGSILCPRAIVDRSCGDSSSAQTLPIKALRRDSYRIGLVHTEPKSRHAIVLVRRAPGELCCASGGDSEEPKRRWRLAQLSCNALTTLRIADALANPQLHHPVFWQQQVSGCPDGSSSTFGGTSKEQCASMRSGKEEDREKELCGTGLNASQERAVKSLLACPFGVELVQGPPGTGKTQTLAVLLDLCATMALKDKRTSDLAQLTKENADHAEESDEGKLEEEDEEEEDEEDGKASEAASSQDPGMQNRRERERAREAKKQRQANRCLVCAPTNIAVQEVAQRVICRLANKSFSEAMLSQVTLVATEDRANIAWNDDEPSDLSAVLLDHRKKRVKRIARYWLGEGHGRNSKPYLRQPAWAWDPGASPLAALLSDPHEAHTKSKAQQQLSRFLTDSLASLVETLDGQVQRLGEDVAFGTEDFEPQTCSKKDKRDIRMERRIHKALEQLRNKMVALRRELASFLRHLDSAWADLFDQNALDLPTSREQKHAGVHVAEETGHEQHGLNFRPEDRKRACNWALWAPKGDPKAVQGLAELLGLTTGQEQSSEDLRKAEKSLKVLLHPDKVQPDLKSIATQAFQQLDTVWNAVRRHVSGRSSSSRSSVQEHREAVRHVRPAASFLEKSLGPAAKSSLEALLAAHEGLRSAAAAVRAADSAMLRTTLLRRCVLVFSTLTVAGRKMMGRQQFPTLLIDEACQSCEAETIISLRSSVQRLFLVGDPRQLPATVSSPLAKQVGFSRSMFERLEQIGTVPLLLEEQYRMDPPILCWSNEEFYHGQIQNAESVLARSQPWSFANLSPKDQHRFGPFRIFDTSHKGWLEEKMRHSFQNEKEAEFLMSLLKTFFSDCYLSDTQPNLSIGIITAYRAQVELFQQLVDDLPDVLAPLKQCVSVATVDGFQGNERDIIAISTVRSGNNTIGFNADERRLNVAVTRAKRFVWIVGDCNTLFNSQVKGNVWRSLVPFARQRGWVIPADPEHRPPSPPPKDPPATPEAWWSSLMHQEWRAQQRYGWMVSRDIADRGVIPYCSLCDKEIDDGHLESRGHQKAKQNPERHLAAWANVDAFFVSLQRDGDEGSFGISTSKDEGSSSLRVVRVAQGTPMARWNDAVAVEYSVSPGAQILEVDGEVGERAEHLITASVGRPGGLAFTVVLPEKSEKDKPPPEPGRSGALWRALLPIKVRAGCQQDSQEVASLPAGTLVVQLQSCQRLPNGLIRMPIKEGWVTLDARSHQPPGPLYFEFVSSPGRGTVWRALRPIQVRSASSLESAVVEEGGLEQGTAVVQYGDEVRLPNGLVRLPIRMLNSQDKPGWVTLNFPEKDLQYFEFFLAAFDDADLAAVRDPGAGALWRTLRLVKAKEQPSLESREVKQFATGDVIEQVGPWQRIWHEDSPAELIRMPICQESRFKADGTSSEASSPLWVTFLPVFLELLRIPPSVRMAQ
eukprot:TRINITY_DN10674_c0_g2_i1.p1 TRINITY_DN10674_c0_g2~~TRINITY_DN10674_c0_g2_i1.p1  ORF type:complete len:2583 (+),score=543.74 TRINITY_DN10674_c0_g2_i1:16-7764(+)